MTIIRTWTLIGLVLIPLIYAQSAAEDAAPMDFARAEAAVKAGNLAEAIKIFSAVAESDESSSLSAKACFNAGVLLRQTDQHELAIGQFEKVIAMKPNDREPGGDLMQAYRNYSHRSAVEIADILEDQGAFAAALEWAESASSDFRYQSWCGTCSRDDADSLEARINRLKALIHREAYRSRLSKSR